MTRKSIQENEHSGQNGLRFAALGLFNDSLPMDRPARKALSSLAASAGLSVDDAIDRILWAFLVSETNVIEKAEALQGLSRAPPILAHENPPAGPPKSKKPVLAHLIEHATWLDLAAEEARQPQDSEPEWLSPKSLTTLSSGKRRQVQ